MLVTAARPRTRKVVQPLPGALPSSLLLPADENELFHRHPDVGLCTHRGVDARLLDFVFLQAKIANRPPFGTTWADMLNNQSAKDCNDT
jgi:hypothetical protein